MKALQLGLLLFFSAATFVSCKKEKIDPPFVFEGSWSGKLGSGSQAPDGQFSMNLKAGNVFERINNSGNVSGTGNWALVQNEFAASYLTTGGVTVYLSGDLDPATKKLSGTWSNNYGVTGKWHATHE